MKKCTLPFNISILQICISVSFIFSYHGAGGLLACKGGELRCHSGLKCVPRANICDKRKDCEDGLDEHQIICSFKFNKGSCSVGYSKNTFACLYYGCIPTSKLCDGSVHCLDGSDESIQACRSNRCKPGQFRCDYGACIPMSQMCNGHVNCADGSDETIHACRNVTCERTQFQCKYGACISSRKMCNSRKDCSYDGSDESDELCLITKAKLAVKWEQEQKRLFEIEKIRQEEVKDELENNLDPEETSVQKSSVELELDAGTTIDTALLEEETTTASSVELKYDVNCSLPKIPKHSDAILTTCLANPSLAFCKQGSYSVPAGTIIQFLCNAGYDIQGPMFLSCLTSGKWSGNPPKCNLLLDVRIGSGNNKNQKSFTPMCPPIYTEEGIVAQCINTETLEVNNCIEPQKPGTEARISCKRYYRSSGDLPVHYEKCNAEGKWKPGIYDDFSCVPDCGISVAPRTAYILNGEVVERGRWPWHVAIYSKMEGKEEWKYICGGTMITESAVITAAHCVTIAGLPRELSSLVVYIGKQSSELPDNDTLVQKRFITGIHVEKTFNYETLESDIAILALELPIILSHVARPICYPQRSNSFIEEYQIVPGNLGTVVGWGYTENRTISDKLRIARLPVVSSSDCASKFREFFASMTRSTNYCAGYENGTSVCNGDSGGGQYFKTVTQGTTRWYLQGIVSYGVPQKDSKLCASDNYAVFTRVGRYGDWIVRVLSKEKLF